MQSYVYTRGRDREGKKDFLFSRSVECGLHGKQTLAPFDVGKILLQPTACIEISLLTRPFSGKPYNNSEF